MNLTQHKKDALSLTSSYIRKFQCQTSSLSLQMEIQSGNLQVIKIMNSKADLHSD